MTDFTITDAFAAHRAMIEARHQASERREKMPSSAAALDGHAAELLELRNKILDLLSEEWHEHRATCYPDYEKARKKSASSLAQPEQRT